MPYSRRKFYALADVASAPIAIKAVRRIDNLLDSNAKSTASQQRLAARNEGARLSPHNDLSSAMDYMLTRWPAFIQFLKSGRVCLINNVSERAQKGVALGRKAWLFAGSDRGGERAADVYSLIVTAELNAVDPRARLTDVLCGIVGNSQPPCRPALPTIKTLPPRRPSPQSSRYISVRW